MCPHLGMGRFIKESLVSMAICRARTATHRTSIELTARWFFEDKDGETVLTTSKDKREWADTFGNGDEAG